MNNPITEAIEYICNGSNRATIKNMLKKVSVRRLTAIGLLDCIDLRLMQLTCHKRQNGIKLKQGKRLRKSLARLVNGY